MEKEGDDTASSAVGLLHTPAVSNQVLVMKEYEYSGTVCLDALKN